MAIFDTVKITDMIVSKISKSIDTLGTEQAKAIIEGFERAANILADRLEQIEKEKK
jgi:hypothetical protein